MWVPLSQATSGRVHVRATWLDLCEDPALLQEQLSSIRQLQTDTKNPLHSAVLMVWVDGASRLNPAHKQIPDPLVRIRVGNTSKDSSVRQRTNDPVFEEGFVFLVRSPLTQEVSLEVRRDSVPREESPHAGGVPGGEVSLTQGHPSIDLYMYIRLPSTLNKFLNIDVCIAE